MTEHIGSNSFNAFKEECRIFNLKQEYSNYDGEVIWAIATDLTEAELRAKYPEVIKGYEPFIMLTMEQADAIIKYRSNERKHEKRLIEKGDIFAYEDGSFELFHPELATSPFDDSQFDSLYEAIDKLTSPHRERLVKKFFYGMTIIEIAAEEQTTKQAISKSINRSLELLKKYLQNG